MYKTGPPDFYSHIWRGVQGVLPLPVELSATDRFWGKTVIVFSCIPAGELSRFQTIGPNPWSDKEPWFNSASHTTNVCKCGKRACGKERMTTGWEGEKRMG